MELARGQIRLRWIITCGTCGTGQEFYGLNESGSKLARRAGWQYTLSRGDCCPTCASTAQASSPTQEDACPPTQEAA